MVCESAQLNKALGALIGGAIGDAMGMPTQMMTREEAHRVYGRVDDYFAPVDWHPVSRGLKAGTVTDDTEQSLLLCQRLIASPDNFDSIGWANDLIDWERDVKERGLHDLLGPSTKRALEALIAGVPATETGIHGNTNGAAMRISPVGIATPSAPLSELIDRVEETCLVTHNTGAAIAAASAVAAATSAGIDGASASEAIELAISAANEAGKRGAGYEGEPVGDAIELALSLLRPGSPADVLEEIADRVGTSSLSHESVPTAFAVFKATNGQVWDAAIASANLGGDTDTIGAIAAGMAGAVSGYESISEANITALLGANELNLEDAAASLLRIRAGRTGGDNERYAVAHA